MAEALRSSNAAPRPAYYISCTELQCSQTQRVSILDAISVHICKNFVYFRFLAHCDLRWRRRSAAVTPRPDQLTNMHRVTMLLGSHHLVPRQLKLLLLEGERFLETLAPEKSFRSGPPTLARMSIFLFKNDEALFAI